MRQLPVIRSSRADQDLIEIWSYVAKDNPNAADRLLRRLDERVQKLQDYPEQGEALPNSNAGMRRIVEGSYLIFYQILDDVIRVVRVLHTSRQWEDVL